MDSKIGILGIAIGIVIVILAPFFHFSLFQAIIISIIIISASLILIFWQSVKKIRDYVQWPIKRPQKNKEIQEPPTNQELVTSRESTIDVCGHDDLQRWNKLFEKAELEIMIQGITLESLNHVTTGIETAMKHVKKVRILLCTPDTFFMHEIETLVSYRNIKNRIQSCVNTMYQTRDSLGSNDKQNLEIRWHKQIPTMTLAIVDDYMQIEPYPYKTPQDKRKIIKIHREGQKELYDVYRKAFENLWNDSTLAEQRPPQHFF